MLLPEVRAQAGAIADTVADYAAQYAEEMTPVLADPARAPHVVPGAARASIQTREMPDHDGMPAAQVYTDNPYFKYMEYGTKYVPELAIFAHTAEHFIEMFGLH